MPCDRVDPDPIACASRDLPVVHAFNMARDDAVAVLAFAKLNQIRTNQWPIVAAWLLASGFDGPALVSVAALDRNATAWDVEPLVPDLMREIGAPRADPDEAALILGATYAKAEPQGAAQHTVIRVLAKAAPELAYPEGWLSACNHAEEFLDCGCDPNIAGRADDLEHTLRSTVPLDITSGLADALTDRD